MKIKKKKVKILISLFISIPAIVLLIVISLIHFDSADHLLKAKKYYKDKDYNSAIGYLDKVVSEDKSNVEAYELLANIYANKGNYIESARIWARVKKLDPFNPVALEKQVACLYIIKAYNAVIEILSPLYSAGTITDVEKVYLGKSYLGKGKTDLALKVATNILADDQNNPSGLLLLGNIYFYQKKINKAKSEYEKINSKEPEILSAKLISIGNCLNFSGKDQEALEFYQKANEISNKSYQAELVLADFYSKNANYQEAIKLLQNLHNRFPESIEIVTSLSFLYFITGNYEKINSLNETIQSKNINYIKLKYYLQAIILFGEGEYEDSIKHFDWAGESFKKTQVYNLCKIFSDLQTRKSKNVAEEIDNLLKKDISKEQKELILNYLAIEAMSAYNENNYNFATELGDVIIKYDFNNIPAHIILMISYFTQDKFKDALVTAKIVLHENPNNITALEILGRIEMRDGRFKNAENYFEKIKELKPEIPNGFYWLGILEMKQGNFVKSIALLNEALKIKSSNITIITALKFAYTSSGKYEDLKAMSNDLINSKENPLKSLGYSFLAELSLKEKKFIQATTYYKKAIEYNPENISNYLYLSKIYSMNQDFTKAYELLLDAETYNTNNKMVLFELAVLADKKGDIKTSRLTYEKIHKLYPDWSLPLINLSSLLADDSKDIEKSLYYAQKAVLLSPTSRIAQQNLGEIYFKSENYKQALVEFEMIVSEDPDNKDAKDYIRRIKKYLKLESE